MSTTPTTKTRKPAMKVRTKSDLEPEYARHRPRADRLLGCIREELSRLLSDNEISLGVPLEGRVKTWDSIADKLDRKRLHIRDISDLPDLVGLRIILLFSQDVAQVFKIINDNLKVISSENTGDRLGDNQFGYQSSHFVVQLKKTWLTVPRYNDLGGLSVEIQVRTLAQHIWAAASHKLQYKHEESVPPPVRRSINRVSALLETVDLEFDRVLAQKKAYIIANDEGNIDEKPLNVDIINIIAEESFPSYSFDHNGGDVEEVLRELKALDINTTAQLRQLISQEHEKVMRADAQAAARYKDSSFSNKERLRQGGYFSHVGLLRQAMIERFGQEEVRKIMKQVGSMK